MSRQQTDQRVQLNAIRLRALNTLESMVDPRELAHFNAPRSSPDGPKVMTLTELRAKLVAQFYQSEDQYNDDADKIWFRFEDESERDLLAQGLRELNHRIIQRFIQLSRRDTDLQAIEKLADNINEGRLHKIRWPDFDSSASDSDSDFFAAPPCSAAQIAREEESKEKCVPSAGRAAFSTAATLFNPSNLRAAASAQQPMQPAASATFPNGPTGPFESRLFADLRGQHALFAQLSASSSAAASASAPSPISAASFAADLLRQNESSLALIRYAQQLEQDKAQLQTEKAQLLASQAQLQQRLDERTDEMANAERRLDEKDKCIICLDKQPDVVFARCKHLACCSGCVASMCEAVGGGVCPLCRTPIRPGHIMKVIRS